MLLATKQSEKWVVRDSRIVVTGVYRNGAISRGRLGKADPWEGDDLGLALDVAQALRREHPFIGVYRA